MQRLELLHFEEKKLPATPTISSLDLKNGGLKLRVLIRLWPSFGRVLVISRILLIDGSLR
jgi:hypothetical protein